MEDFVIMSVKNFSHICTKLSKLEGYGKFYVFWFVFFFFFPFHMYNSNTNRLITVGA